MTLQQSYKQGEDAQAIHMIATEYYGGLQNMFETHGWQERGGMMMTSASAHIVDQYGSIRGFEEKHRSAGMIDPADAIKSDPPNVWLTSLYGFRPDKWGLFGFTKEADRQRFLKRSLPGVLVVIYAASGAKRDKAGNIIGIQQCSHEMGTAEEFMCPNAWLDKQNDPNWRAKWNYGVRVVRAWRVTPESQINVRDFAPLTTATGAWQYIGAAGEQLKSEEALKLLRLDIIEVPVYHGLPIAASVASSSEKVFSPSKAGPVAQSAYTAREAEGPKHLYILKLTGDPAAFLGKDVGGLSIYKVGFSCSPITRCNTLNSCFPEGIFQWRIEKSTYSDGRSAYPSSQHAIAGENAMKNSLDSKARSLGNEFFLAARDEIENAWMEGNIAAAQFEGNHVK